MEIVSPQDRRVFFFNYLLVYFELTIKYFCSQSMKAKEKVEVESSKVDEPKERKLSILNGFSNGSALGDVRQRMAGAVASQ